MVVTTRQRHAQNQSSKKEGPERKQTKWGKRPGRRALSSFKSGDEYRDHVREMLVAALSRVADEVGEEMKEEVRGCDVQRVAVSIETALYEKLGVFKPFESPRLLKEVPIRMKYRRIMSHIDYSNNLHVRRELLVGQLSPQELIARL